MTNNLFSTRDLMIALNISPDSVFGKTLINQKSDDVNVLRLLVEEVKRKNSVVTLESCTQVRRLLFLNS